MNKLSVITNFLGEIRNRFLVYQEDRTLTEKFQLAKQIKDIIGVELAYPKDFVDYELLKKLLKDYNFEISAINFRSRRSGQWFRGSFTSAMEHERKEVVKDMKKCIDYARDLGCPRITTCPLNEGQDYIFEIDYESAYCYFEETLREIAEYAKEIKISIEYKQSEPRVRSLLANAGETLAFCQNLGMDNVGVTLDFGHSIFAGESPAQALVMLARANKLFYIHLNDNDRVADWDMIPGAINFWDNIEFLYYLKKIRYDDWIAFDVFPKEINTVETYNSVTSMTKKLMEIANRIDEEKIQELLIQRNPAKTIEYLYSLI